MPTTSTRRPGSGWISPLLRAALIVIGIYVAIAVGAPWLLYEAPPSAEDVLVSGCAFS